MCPFPGAIGRFWMHGAEILPSRAAFRVEGARDHAWREELASAARPLRDSGLQFGRMGSAPYRPYLDCLTHERTPAILVVLIAITPCRRLAIAAPPACCPRLTRTPLRPPIPLPHAPPPPASPPAPPTPRRAPATRCTSPRRAGPAAVPVIPAKWCGDTIAHTRKLRF